MSVKYITKSMLPNSLMHLLTDFSKLSMLLTSTAPMPSTCAPFLAVAMSLATRSVFSTFRPTIQAFAPRCTSALTWALQIEPAPPVQKTTLLSENWPVSMVRIISEFGVYYQKCHLSIHRSYIHS